jgi:hypothetical protein
VSINVPKPSAKDTTSGLGRSPERKAFVCEYEFVDEGTAPGTFEGSVLNNENDGGDLILPGAFAGAIQRHQVKSTMPKMLLNHGSMGGFFGGSDLMADLPVGRWNTMSERYTRLAMQGPADQSRHRERKAGHVRTYAPQQISLCSIVSLRDRRSIVEFIT